MSDHPHPTIEPIEIELRDGRRATIRAVEARDADALQHAIRSMSLESRYSRFFSPLRELPPKLLERATHPEPGRELQLVAVITEGGQTPIVGGARYAALERGKDCEFAVAIVDGWHGLGLARRLLELLMQHAHAGGFERMEGYVLATNKGMLGLASRLGFEEMASTEGPTVRTVRRELGAEPRPAS